ncbi:MAG: hypothetical protein RIB84_17370 [Sneathiellaceae bacterium]
MRILVSLLAGGLLLAAAAPAAAQQGRSCNLEVRFANTDGVQSKGRFVYLNDMTEKTSLMIEYTGPDDHTKTLTHDGFESGRSYEAAGLPGTLTFIWLNESGQDDPAPPCTASLDQICRFSWSAESSGSWCTQSLQVEATQGAGFQ